MSDFDSSDFIDETILKIFGHHAHLSLDEAQAWQERDFLQEGAFSSVDFISFVSDIEDFFEINFEASEFEDVKFKTIRGIAAIISFKKVKIEPKMVEA